LISIRERELRGKTAWCIACMNAGGDIEDEMVCDMCRGFIATFFHCPACYATSHFLGFDYPPMCDGCGTIYPDISLMKIDAEERVYYHLSEHLK
jgi:hypothetical protein